MSDYVCSFKVGDRVRTRLSRHPSKGDRLGTIVYVQAVYDEEENEEGELVYCEDISYYDIRVEWDGGNNRDYYDESELEHYDDSKSHIPEDWS